MYDELISRLRDADEKSMCGECGLNLHTGATKKGVLFAEAADAIEELSRENESLAKSVNEASEILRKRWIPVTERLPESGVHVLLACKTLGGNKYVCDGFHTEKFSQPTEFYENIDADYSEETDEYYFPEGWWEVIKNWDDYSCVAIEDTVTHWMPLPQPPKEET